MPDTLRQAERQIVKTSCRGVTGPREQIQGGIIFGQARDAGRGNPPMQHIRPGRMKPAVPARRPLPTLGRRHRAGTRTSTPTAPADAQDVVR
jgi:hypothetical protein